MVFLLTLSQRNHHLTIQAWLLLRLLFREDHGYLLTVNHHHVLLEQMLAQVKLAREQPSALLAPVHLIMHIPRMLAMAKFGLYLSILPMLIIQAQLVLVHLAHMLAAGILAADMLAKVTLVLEHPPALLALVHLITIFCIENSIAGLQGSSRSVASAR